MPLCKKCQLKRAVAQLGLELEHVDGIFGWRKPTHKGLTRDQLKRFIKLRFYYFLSHHAEHDSIRIYNDKKGRDYLGVLSMEHAILMHIYNFIELSFNYSINNEGISIPEYTEDVHDYTSAERLNDTINFIVGRIMKIAKNANPPSELIFVKMKEYELVKKDMENPGLNWETLTQS